MFCYISQRLRRAPVGSWRFAWTGLSFWILFPSLAFWQGFFFIDFPRRIQDPWLIINKRISPYEYFNNIFLINSASYNFEIYHLASVLVLILWVWWAFLRWFRLPFCFLLRFDLLSMSWNLTVDFLINLSKTYVVVITNVQKTLTLDLDHLDLFHQTWPLFLGFFYLFLNYWFNFILINLFSFL